MIVEPVSPESRQPRQRKGRTQSDGFRTPPREIADLLATALLRLRRKNAGHPESEIIGHERAVQLGFSGQQRVHDNPSEPFGDCL